MANDISKQNVIELYRKAKHNADNGIKGAEIPEGHLKSIIMAKTYLRSKSNSK